LFVIPEGNLLIAFCLAEGHVDTSLSWEQLKDAADTKGEWNIVLSAARIGYSWSWRLRGSNMAKIRNPARFSEQFNIDTEVLARAGVLNPTLNADTRLFIDPLLLQMSSHPEISQGARSAYVQYFNRAIGLIQAIKATGDTYWKNAWRLLSFPEIKGTCLGYGAESIAGSGSGDAMTDQVLKTAKEIVDLGIKDPDLFVAMALLEDNFGPDRISDMTTNIIFGDLLEFNYRVLSAMEVPKEKFQIRLKNGRSYDATLPRNPYAKGRVPVILVPTDILRDLPVATDWQDISIAASESAEIRNSVNDQIAQLWRTKTLKDKEGLREWALSDREAFDTLLKMIHGADISAYDMQGDPSGEVFWRQLLVELASNYPFTIEKPKQLDLNGVKSVVEKILSQFQFLIEERRFSEELYHEDNPRPEKAAQRLFFAVAYSYCKANNLDITPEAETGVGPVDFKVASGFNGRVLVEVKLSTNKKLLKGYTRQLEAYKTAEETLCGYYVVIDVGGPIAKKRKALLKLRNDAITRKETASPIVFIDGLRKPSASKL
jgi:hypothetical protein